MAGLVIRLTGEQPSHRGRDTCRWRAKGSLAVVIAGPKRGMWHDHEAGQGGDALALVAHVRRKPLRDAITWARAYLGGAVLSDRPLPRKPAAAAVTSTVPMARSLWLESVPADGTPVEAYLASRGLRLEDDAPIRFHPSCPRGAERLPAMLALMSSPETGASCGVHRTFLKADGSGKADGHAKMMIGEAGIIRLTPAELVGAGLGIAEGIETSLTVMQAFDWRPVWAAASAGGIACFPVLRGIESLTIFADADGAGFNAARRCAERWAEAGREATMILPPAGDFNDLHNRPVA